MAFPGPSGRAKRSDARPPSFSCFQVAGDLGVPPAGVAVARRTLRFLPCSQTTARACSSEIEISTTPAIRSCFGSTWISSGFGGRSRVRPEAGASGAGVVERGGERRDRRRRRGDGRVGDAAAGQGGAMRAAKRTNEPRHSPRAGGYRVRPRTLEAARVSPGADRALVEVLLDAVARDAGRAEPLELAGAGQEPDRPRIGRVAAEAHVLDALERDRRERLDLRGRPADLLEHDAHLGRERRGRLRRGRDRVGVSERMGDAGAERRERAADVVDEAEAAADGHQLVFSSTRRSLRPMNR